MSNANKHTADMAKAMLESRAMKERADYLRRGREHVGLTTEAAQELWIATFQAWVSDRTQNRERAFNDVNAELDLRGESLPFEKVPNEVEVIRKELLLACPNSPELHEAIDEFREELRGPRN